MRLLDLFCGAGGAAMGYSRVGFDVVGVDIKPQKRYPFEFVQADALEFVAEHGHEFDVIHASPPCQAYSIMRNLPWLREKDYPRLIDPTRDALNAVGLPWVIENVMGAKLAAGWLCGGMFGLPFYRHRAFETNWFWMQPGHPAHLGVIRKGRMFGNRGNEAVYIRPSGFKGFGFDRAGSNVGNSLGVGLVREAYAIDWMDRKELAQAIPPVYTQYIGERLMEQLQREGRAA